MEVSESLEDKINEMAIDMLNRNVKFKAKQEVNSMNGYVLKKIDNTLEPSKQANTELVSRGPSFNGKKVKKS